MAAVKHGEKMKRSLYIVFVLFFSVISCNKKEDNIAYSQNQVMEGQNETISEPLKGEQEIIEKTEEKADADKDPPFKATHMVKGTGEMACIYSCRRGLIPRPSGRLKRY
jgi:hypothetical protein